MKQAFFDKHKKFFINFPGRFCRQLPDCRFNLKAHPRENGNLCCKEKKIPAQEYIEKNKPETGGRLVTHCYFCRIIKHKKTDYQPI
jgi:hypothetical protein